MAAKQTPSRSLYIIQVGSGQREAVSRLVAKLGSVEEVKGRSDLALIRLHDDSNDPRVTWEKARKAIGGAALVQPVLMDSEGRSQLPTGEVTVRFRGRLSDDDLERFAAAHGLRLRNRNEFVPEQAVFEVLEQDRYLPDVVEELSTNKDTRQAWANTLAQFDRE